jgi:hypothetical protein
MAASGAIALYADRTARAAGDSSTSPAPDSNLVAVLPFRINGSDPGMPDLRDWIQDLLAARMTGEGSPLALSRRDVTEALGDMGATELNGISSDAARRVHARTGAALVLNGELDGNSERLAVSATLAALPSASTVARARAEGSADSLPYLVDRLITRLLAVRAAGWGEDSAALAQTTLPALRAHLAGWAAYRRGLIHEAHGYFDRAQFLDSTFLPARLGLATIENNYWSWTGGDTRWLADDLWSRRHLMSAADRALLVAYLGPRYPARFPIAERIAAAEEATQVAPARVEAWYIAATRLLGFGAAINPAWEARGLDALQRAFALDSTHAPTLERLTWQAAGAGDQAAVRRYADLYLTYNPRGRQNAFVPWLAAVTAGDHAALERLRDGFARIGGQNALNIIAWSQRYGVGLDDADRVSDTDLRTARGTVGRKEAAQRQVRLHLNRGRPAMASGVITRFPLGFLGWNVGIPEFRVYAALYWDGDTGEAAVAVRDIEDYLDGPRSSATGPHSLQSASCVLAHWRVARRDFSGALAALARLGRSAATDSLDAPGPPVCIAAVRALAGARHAPGAARDLARLDSLLRIDPVTSDLQLVVGNLIAARLHEARGDLPRAREAIRRGKGWPNFLSTLLREEGRLAAQAGDTVGAIRAYRHYLALRSNPEPRLRPDAERVRADLARLERGESRSAP